MMKRKGRTAIAVGEFGAWLLANMALKDWTYGDCAKALDICPETICNHVRHRERPEFKMVVAYCWAFDMRDDPRMVWKLVNRDWG